MQQHGARFPVDVPFGEQWDIHAHSQLVQKHKGVSR